MKPRFIQVDRDTLYLLPPSIQDWLPEGHLARFVVEIVEQLNLQALKASYAGRGSSAYHPEMLVALLFYGYATGCFSSRKLERNTYDSVAFRFVAANAHPDHDTIASFRRRFLPELKELFVQILRIAHTMGVLKVGVVSLDGTKIQANASKHKALSYEHACKLEKQIKEEVAELMRLADSADHADVPDGMSLPEELTRRTERLKAIAEAKAEIERRAAERHAKEQEVYDRKIAAREKKEQETGKKPGGKPPTPPMPGPAAKDQVNLTDSESRIMPTAGGGFMQAYNAQAGVDTQTMMIVTSHLTQQSNDKLEVNPTLDAIADLPKELGSVDTLLADNGYFSETNVGACEENQVVPYFSAGREKHNPPLMERFSEPPALPEDADPVAKMKHRLKTKEGKALYGTRKSTVEPVFGIIKAVMGFRQFLLRGLESVEGEWDLVCIAWNLKRLHILSSVVPNIR